MPTLRRPPQLYKSLALVVLSLSFLPLNLYILFSCYVLQILSPFAHARRVKTTNVKRYLVAGVNNAVGLSLARNLYLSGHHVVGVDHELYNIKGSGRYSKAIRNFYTVPGITKELGAADYMHKLLDIIKSEKIDIFISCASFTSAGEDAITKSVIEKLTNVKCLALDPEASSRVSSKPAFLELAKSIGLHVPEIHSVTSRDQIHKILGPATKKERSYTLTKVRSGRARVDSNGNTLLPRRSLSQTYQLVSQVSVSSNDPYVLEEHMSGEEYSSYVLLSDGVIQNFAACHEPQGNIVKRLHTDSPLYHAILRMTKQLTTALPENSSGPLTFSFRVQMLLTKSGYEKKLVPRDCVPKVGIASLLLHTVANSHRSSYGTNSAVTTTKNIDNALTVQGNHDIYWLASDYFELVLQPLYNFFRWRIGIHQLWTSWSQVINHIMFWQEATFIIWDPLPWFWQYSIFWPLRLVAGLSHRDNWNTLDVTNNELRFEI